MLYALFKPLMKAALRLYFRRIVVSGMQHIDNGKPTLILANHTASFMDAMITACYVKRRIYFFTRGDVFRHPVADKLMRGLGMLPVYRMSDGRDKLQLNDSSNEEALRILARGGAVLIFAEGSSDVAKVLKPLKKGPFRLAVTAAATLPEAPLLVPLGINYVNPVGPFDDAFLIAAPPVRAAGFTSKSESEAARNATELMRAMAAAIRPLAWHVGDPERLEEADTLLRALKDEKPDYSFEDSQELLNKLGTTDGQLAYQPNGRLAAKGASLWHWILLFLLAPLGLAGFLFNYPPVYVATRIVDARVHEPDFRAPVFLSLTVVGVISWYVLWLLTAVAIGAALTVGGLLMVAAGCGIFYIKMYRPILMFALGRPGQTVL